LVYLDNAATTFPKPQSVTRAMSAFMKHSAANPGRSGHRLSMAAAKEVYDCRCAAAEMFGAPGPECVAFTLNATHAINFALKGALSGGRVVTSCLEHNAVMRPLTALTAQGKAAWDEAEVDLSDDDAVVERFTELIRPDTALVACTHASNLCGRILPIARIGAICRDRNVKFLVDASQSAGILPIDIAKMHIDYLCMPGHKGLYGPMGTGMLITSEGSRLNTLIEGGTGSLSSSLEQPDIMPDRFESGTVNAPGIAGLRAGIGFVKEHDPENIFAKEIQLAILLYDGLKNIKGVTLYTPRPTEGYVPVISFNIGDMSSVKAAAELDKMGICLRGGLHCAPEAHRYFGTLSQGMVRASIGAFNTREDISYLLNSVNKLTKTRKQLAY
jgi:cysteine desulfurase/selenocysteine lyase